VNLLEVKAGVLGILEEQPIGLSSEVSDVRVAARDTPPRNAALRATSQFVGVEFYRPARCAISSGLGS
jgi:hypothetical protein